MEIRTPAGHFVTRSANPYAYWGSSAPAANGQLGMIASGVTISETTALQIAAVYGATAVITDSIATLPIKQYRMTPDGPKEMDPAPVIEQPWAEITQRDFITQGTMSMLLAGNLYGQVAARNDRLYPEQVKLIHPDHARVRRNRDSGQVEVSYWNKVIPPDDVTRAMALAVPEALVGLNPIQYMRDVMGLARAQDLYNGAFYSNSARPDYVIKVPGDLDIDEAKSMKEAVLASQQGISHSHLPLVLTGGAEVEALSLSNVDAQFLEMMQWSASVISGIIYRVPPHMLGMTDKSTSWGNGIEQQELGFVRNTLLIWLNRWEDLMRSWLPPRQFVAFDLSQRLRGDTLQRWGAYQIARITGAMNNEEIRAAEGLPKVTDPDQAAILADFAAPLNSSPVKPGSGGGTGGSGGDKAD